MPTDPDMSFDKAGDLRFSDLGPKRVATAEGNAAREAANAEATWNTVCPQCGEHLSGSLEKLKLHDCRTE